MTDNFERALQERLLARSQVSNRDVEALRRFARTLPARRSIWQRPVFGWALAGAAVALAAAVALPQLFATIPGPGATPSAAPATPTPAPTQPAETPVPTPDVADPTIPPLDLEGRGLDGGLVIDNSDGLVRGAAAVRGGFMSNRWLESTVEQVSPTRIKVTWAAYPDESIVDAKVTLTPSGGIEITIYQRLPLPQTDAEGEDRILLLELDREIDANDVEVSIQSPEPPAE